MNPVPGTPVSNAINDMVNQASPLSSKIIPCQRRRSQARGSGKGGSGRETQQQKSRQLESLFLRGPRDCTRCLRRCPPDPHQQPVAPSRLHGGQEGKARLSFPCRVPTGWLHPSGDGHSRVLPVAPLPLPVCLLRSGAPSARPGTGYLLQEALPTLRKYSLY